jgi:glycosyltransferase involved in cell wall biosynthesis
MSKPTICVATVRAATVRNTVNAIRQQSIEDFELIVVGQGDDVELRHLGAGLAALDSRIRYNHLADRGLSAARNAAIQASSGEFIAFTDDDCEPDEFWLSTLMDSFEAGEGVGLVGGTVVAPKTKGWLCTCPSLAPSDSLYDPAASPGQSPPGFGWIGANFAVRRSVFDEVGTFDENLGAGSRFPAGEDVDFKLRCEKAGIRMRSNPAAIVYHTFGARCGIRARWVHHRNYSQGNGAIAAKLSLSGDDRGGDWMQRMAQGVQDRLRRGRLLDAMGAGVRYVHARRAYRECCASMEVNAAGNLAPVDKASPESSLG